MENVDMAVNFPFSIFNLSTTTVVIDLLKLTFLCDATSVSLSGSNVIFFFLGGGGGKTTEEVGSLAFYKTAGYCLDDCFASCENIVWIWRMYGRLLPPLPLV